MGFLDDVGNVLSYTSPASYFTKEALSRNGGAVNVLPQPPKSTISDLPDFSSWTDDQIRKYMGTINGTLNNAGTSTTDAQTLQGQLGTLQNELNTRINNQNRSDITNAFSDTGATSDQNIRNAIDQIFGNQQNVQTQNLNNLFSQQRGNAIEEAAALGNLRQPGFQSSTLNNIDAQKSQAMAQLLGTLGAGQGQARVGAENDIANRNLQRAGSMASLLTGQSNFGQNFGLQQNQFNSNQRQQSMDNLFNQQAMDQAGQLGQMQANAQKKSPWDTLGGIAGGIGGLAGGTGQLLGGLKGLGLFSKAVV